MTERTDTPTTLSTTTRYLPVMLTHAEMLDRIDEYQQTLRLQTEMEDRHKAEAQKLKDEKERMKGRVSAEGAIIEARAEERRVEVQTILYPKTLEVVEIRTDTGEQLSKRPARQEELQRMVPFEGGLGAVLDAVAEQVNAGSLDSEGATVTMRRGRSDDSEAEG